ncbi:MAG: DUF7453 family protein, partial [Limisphaerales bacterium]
SMDVTYNLTVLAYEYKLVAALGQTAPGGEQYISYFETGEINNFGDVIFGAEVASIPDGTDLGEGTFLTRFGHPLALELPAVQAPGGGGTFFELLSPTTLNDRGEGATAVQLNTFQSPLGMGVGLYRGFGTAALPMPVVVPGVTMAPNGLPFAGASYQPVLNNRGQLLFNGLISTSQGIVPAQGLGLGMFIADQFGHISNIVSPGDAAPGGGTFDFAETSWINDMGDVAFGAHIAGEECVGNNPPTLANQAGRIFCGDNVYVKLVGRQSVAVAHQGTPAPDGGTFRHSWGPVINNLRQVLFVGDLTAPPNNDAIQGLYLYNAMTRTTVPVIRPGDTLPDGAHVVTVSDFSNGHHLNNRGEVSFVCQEDTGGESLWVKSDNALRFVAKTGQTFPGIGTIADFDVEGGPMLSGALNNDWGQVFFAVDLTGGGTAMLIATPAFAPERSGADAAPTAAAPAPAWQNTAPLQQ